jgi:hypothetical protein
MDGSKSIDLTRDSFWATILVSFVIAGIVGVAWTGYAWATGQNIPRTLVESGPFLLVLVTLINIGLSGLGFLEARKERRLTRQTLAEYRKDGIIETIVRLIETTNDQLQIDEIRLKQAQEAPVTYPVLKTAEEPEEELLQDLSPVYPEITADFREYFRYRNEYAKQREKLKEKLIQHVPDGLTEDRLNELLNATGSSLESTRPHKEGDSFYQRLSEYSDDLAYVTLRGERPDVTKGWVSDNISDIRDTLIELRSTEEFSDEFEQLETLQEDLITKNREIQEQSSEAKAKLKEQYNISEAEIRKRRENTSDYS